jgi:hypothetical protein
MRLEIIRLHLVSPLYYLRDEGIDRNNANRGNNPGNVNREKNRENMIEAFSYREGEGEMLFHFELDPNQSQSIEPDEGLLLSALIGGGRAADPAEICPGEALLLPEGNYLFSQVREILSRGDIESLAAEVQKEGLWQRLSPGNELYLRYLFEDGRGVTQILRPYTGL